MVSVQSNLSADDNLYFQPLPSAGITTSDHQALEKHNLDPSRVQFTVGFSLLRESNATADLTGG